MKESDVLRAVSDLLAAKGFAVFRRNTGAFAGTYRKKDGTLTRRFLRFSQPGMADLYGWDRKTGRHLEVEIKATGKPIPITQSTWLAMAWEQGCVAFAADSAEDALLKLRGYGY